MTQRMILRSGAAGLALSLSLGWSSPASAFLDTEGAWNDVLQFAVRQINAPGEFEIELGRVTRPEDGFARIESLSLRDGDGEWVNARGIVIDWRVRSLLRARFNFQTLSAEEINVLRAPIGRGDPPADEAQISFSWPRPPTSLTIDKLRIDKLTVSESLVPQAIEAKVEGSFSDIGDAQKAALTITRTDGKRGEFKFSGDLDFDKGAAKLSLGASEAAGGLVATAAGLPDDQDVELTFSADGGFEHLPFAIGGRIGEMGAAQGEGSVAFRGLPAVKFSGSISPDERASATWRQALGTRSTLTLDAKQVMGGGYQLNAFSVESPILVAEGAGSISPAQDQADLKIQWRAPDPEAFSAVIAPTRFTAMSGSAEITGRAASPTAKIDAVIEGLQGDFGALDKAELKISAAPPAGAPRSGPTDSLFTADVGVTGFAPRDPALLEALGPDPKLRMTGAYRATQALAAIDSLNLTARGLEMTGKGAFDLRTKLFDGNLSGVAAQISPFARLAGIDLSGAADFKLNVAKAGAAGAKGIELEAGLRDLDSADPNLKAALGREATVTLNVAESAPGVMRVTKGGLNSASVVADVTGELSPKQDRVDLALDWRVTDPQALAGFAPGLDFSAAAGQAAIRGTLSEPQFSTTAQVDQARYGGMSMASLALEAEGQSRKDRRAPFSFSATIATPDLGDPALNGIVGAAPKLTGRGIHDLATGLFTLEDLKAELAAGEAEASGEANLTDKTLGFDLRAYLPDLNALSALAPEPLSGAGRLWAKATGSFDAPVIEATLEADAPRYGDRYGAEMATLTASATIEKANIPFKARLNLENPSLGDPGLEEAVGQTPTFALEGGFDRAAQILRLRKPSQASLAPGDIAVTGDVDLGAKELNLALDTESLDLARLSTLAGGAEIGGALAATINLTGGFDSPRIGVKGGGADLFYDQYHLSQLEIDYGPTPRADGGVPFTATAVLDGEPLRDPHLRAALGGSPRVRATGAYNQATGRVTLDSAKVTAAVGEIDLKGWVETKAKTLDLQFAANLKDLAPLSGYAQGELSGAFTGSGSATGSFSAPRVNFKGSAKAPMFDGRGADGLSITASLDPQSDGALDFKAELDVQGPRLGDSGLEALLGDPSLKAEGRFNPDSGLLRLTSANLKTPAGEADLSGSFGTKDQSLDFRFNADFKDLESFSKAAGQRMGGALSAEGRLTGSVSAPRLNFLAEGEDLVFDKYAMQGVKIDARTMPGRNGDVDFSLTAEARGPGLGDPKLDAVLGDAKLTATGLFNAQSGRITLRPAEIKAAAGEIWLSGAVNSKTQTIDLQFSADVEDLARFSEAAGEPLSGTLTASGEIEGSFTAPLVNVKAKGGNLRYGQYGLANLDLDVQSREAADGVIPFTAKAEISKPRLGDPKIEALIGDLRFTATGEINSATGLLRLTPAELRMAAGTARLSGAYGTKDQSLNLDFSTNIRDLARLSAAAGEELGGALTASGKLEGTVSAPRVKATAKGSDLRYGQYALAGLELDASSAPDANGLVPFEVKLSARRPRLGDPKIEALLGTVGLEAKGAFNSRTGVVRLDPAELRMAAGTARLSGTYGTRNQALNLDFAADVKDLARLSEAAGEELAGSLSASGKLEGTVSAPRVKLSAKGEEIRYGQYGLAGLDLDVTSAPNDTGLVPFEVKASARRPRLGDPKIEALLGDVGLTAKGSFNTRSGVLTLSPAEATTAAGTARVSGSYGTRTQSLNLDFATNIRDLARLSEAAGEPLSGSLTASGKLQGTVAAPRVNLTAKGAELQYGQYGVAGLDLTVKSEAGANGVMPFEVKGSALRPRLGDPQLEALLGDVSVEAKGAFDTRSGLLTLEPSQVSVAAGSARVSGSFGTKDQSLDLEFSTNIRDLSPLSGLAGQALAGSLNASGRVEGSVSAPRLNMTAQGQSLQYGPYAVAGLNLKISSAPGPDGTIPFSVEADARGPRLGDPQLDGLLGDVKLSAQGSFNPASGQLNLSPAQVTAGLGSAQVSGSFNTKTQALALDVSANVSNLAPLSGLAGHALGGSLSASGRVEGSVSAPRLNMAAQGQSLQYGQYSIANLNLNVSSAPGPDGTIPFSVQADARGPRLGDPQLDALIGDVKLSAQGNFNPTSGQLNLSPAQITAGLGSAQVSGSFNTKTQALALDVSTNVSNLAPLSGLAGQALGGSLSVSGRVEGSVSAPRLNMTAQGQSLQYGQYSVAGLNLKISSAPGPDGTIPFSVEADARGPRLGDPQLDALIGDVKLSAQGSFNPASGQLNLSPAQITAGLGSAQVSGSFNAKTQALALDVSANVSNLAPLSGLAGQALGGSLSASGRVEGSVSAPRLNMTAQGQSLQYGQYGVAGLNLKISSAPGPDGTIPFSVEADARGPRLGDPQLDGLLGDVTLSAQGSFNPASGQLNLAPAQVTAGLGSAQVSGSFNTKTQALALDVSANVSNLAPLSGLTGQTLGGSLSASGRIEGSISAPRLNMTAQGQNLQYGPYGVANLNLSVSSAPGPDGTIPFSVDADLRGPRLGDPQLDALIGDVKLAARGSFNPNSGLLNLAPAQVATGLGFVQASGSFGTKDQSLNLEFSANISNLAPLSGLAGQTLGGALSASGRIEGTISAPRLNMTAQGQSLQYGQYSVAGLNLSIGSAPGPDGSIPFNAQAQASGLRLGDPRIEQLLGEATLTAQGSYNPTAKQISLHPAELRMAAGHLRASGLIDLANQALAMDVNADLPNLAALSGFAGKPISGAARLDARIEGPFADPSARGAANVGGFSYDGMALGDAQAQFNLARLVSAPQGDVSLNAQTPQGPLTLSARLASQGGSLTVQSFRLEGLGIFGEGGLNLGAGGLMEGSARFNATSLSILGALLGYEAQGALNAEATFSGASGRQSVTARGSVTDLRIAQNGGFLAGIMSLNFNAQIDDALGADPYVRATAEGQRLEAAGLLFSTVRLGAQGPLSNLDLTADVTGDFLDEGLRELDTISLQARVNAAGGFQGVSVHRFNGRISGEDLSLAAVLEIRKTPDGGFGFQNLDLRVSDGGQLGGYFTTASNGAFGHVVLHHLPLRLLRLTGLPPAEGRLFGEAQFDSRSDSGRFTLRTEGMTMVEAGLTSPIQANAEGTLAGGQLTASVNMTSASFSQPLTANARLTLTRNGGLPTPDRNGPISAKISWAGDLGEIWPLLPLPDHLLSGYATLSASIDGTLAAPRTAGGLRIQNGRYEHLDFGTVIQGLSADAAFSSDGRLTLTAQGGDGYGGQISALGSYVVSSRVLEAKVQLNRMAAARRDDLTAIVSGEIRANGDANQINVGGTINNEFLEFRLIGGGAPNLVVIEATPVGVSAPRTPRAARASASAASQRINLNLTVNVPGQAYVRGRGLESEWGGQLQVTGHAGDVQVNGMIQKRRGWLDLLGRQFDLEIGEVRFAGPLDPYVTVRLTAEANDIRGWLQVAGYSSDPKVSFGSDQGLPEEEVLPRLLFGRSKQSLSAIEAAQLAAGVATLMSERPGAMDMLRDVAGVDTLRIEEGSNGGTAISTGKYIADGVFVGARQDLGTGGTTALVEIETFNNIVIDAEIGADETKAGVNWKLDY